jgi:hypothetical protein
LDVLHDSQFQLEDKDLQVRIVRTIQRHYISSALSDSFDRFFDSSFLDQEYVHTCLEGIMNFYRIFLSWYL